MAKGPRSWRAPGLAALLTVLSLASVTVEAAEIKSDIPFSFMVGKTELPAGTYRFSSSETTLVIRGLNHSAIVQSDTVLSGTDASTRVVFNKYGDRHFLSQAWMGAGRGRRLRPSPAEREVAAARRDDDPAGRQVVVAGK